MECTPKASLIGGLLCCLFLAIVFGWMGGKSVPPQPAVLALALCSCCSAMSNMYSLSTGDGVCK